MVVRTTDQARRKDDCAERAKHGVDELAAHGAFQPGADQRLEELKTMCELACTATAPL